VSCTLTILRDKHVGQLINLREIPVPGAGEVCQRGNLETTASLLSWVHTRWHVSCPGALYTSMRMSALALFNYTNHITIQTLVSITCPSVLPWCSSIFCNPTVGLYHFQHSVGLIRDSSVGIVIRLVVRPQWKYIFSFPAGARDFSLLWSIQTGSGAHLVVYCMGTKGIFPRAWSDRGLKWVTITLNAWGYACTPQMSSWLALG
jgi:hypothetical protein